MLHSMQNFKGIESNEIAYIFVTLLVHGMLSNRREIIVSTVVRASSCSEGK